MATRVKLTSLSAELERRIRVRLRTIEPDSPRMRETLIRIGFLLEAETKLNIVRKHIVDTGRLLNSIKHELFQKGTQVGVRVGSFGVPYAAIHEFGGIFRDDMRRAMFASLRDKGRLGPEKQGQNKGVITGGLVRARPFLRPAIRRQKRKIIEILKDMVRSL